MPRATPQSIRALAALFATSLPLAHLSAQTSYTWDGNGDSNNGGNWSVAANWTSDHVPVAGGNIAVLGDVTSGTRTIVYDSGASGFTSTVQFNQTTAGATNLLSIQKNFTISNAVTVGAADGTARISLGVFSGSNLTLTVANAGGLTLGTNGVLALGADNTGKVGNFTGNLTISGGSLQMMASTNGSSATNLVTGNLTMSAGSIVIDNLTGQADRRLTVSGDTTVTGGTISSTRNGTSGMLTLSGATVTFNPASFDSDLILTLDRGGNQSLATDQTLAGSLLLRGSGIKTVTRTAGDTIHAITFIDGNSGSATGTSLKLGSDLALAGGAAQPTVANFSQSVDGSAAIQVGIDTGGYTLDLAAGAGSGVWTPIKSTSSGVTTTEWTLGNSGAAGAGGIKAAAFLFNASGAVVNVGSGLTLTATGGNGTATHLGTAGTFAADARFTYAGSADGGTPATLSSGRAIGALDVDSGALQITGSTFAAAGGITVDDGALLDFSTQTVSTDSITLRVSGASVGQIKTAGTYAFGGNLFVDFVTAATAGDVLDLFQFTDSHTNNASFTSITLSGAHATSLSPGSGVWTGTIDGLTFSFDQLTGDLSVTSAIPEPATWTLLGGLGALGFAASRRRRRA